MLLFVCVCIYIYIYRLEFNAKKVNLNAEIFTVLNTQKFAIYN